MNTRDTELSVTEQQVCHDPPWSSLDDLVTQAATGFGAREFLRFEDGTSLSFAEFDRLTRHIAQTLVSRGVLPGDRVAIMMSNGPGWPLSWLGVLRAHAVAVPVNSRYQASDLAYVLQDSGASMVLTDDALHAPVVNSAEEFSTVRCVVPISEILSAPTPPISGGPTQPPLKAGDVANLQYTSGTTGLPKACVLTNDYWLRVGWLAAAAGEMSRSDVVLTSQPYSYIDPQWQTVMCLISGATLVVLPRFSVSGFWPAIREHEVSFFYVLGTMPLLLFRQPESTQDREHHVRLVMCSGIPPGMHKNFEERWGAPWREVFGMTETGIDLFVPSRAEETVGTGAMGKPVANKEVRVASSEGETLGDGEVGEMIIRGAPMMREYYNRPDDTAAAIIDGWLHTGDLVFRDQMGWFHLVGRSKDMVRRGGENISAAEVENVLGQHPFVVASAVTAIPDELFGEEVKAFVKLREGSMADLDNVRSLLAFARSRVASFKVPRYVEFVGEFPMTPSERISKPKLLAEQRLRRRNVYDAHVDSWLDEPDDGF